MIKRSFILSLLMILIIPACNFKEREAEIKKRSDELAQKEQHLLTWEKNLKLKEDSINLLLARRDSVTFADSIALLPPLLAGEWAAKMVCTQTTCTSSAIGDVQTDNWQISSQDSSLIIKSLVRGQVNRIYTGNYYQNNTIRVSDRSDNASASNSPIRIVEITDIRENKMKGTRVVIQPDGCHVTYSLELDKKQ